MKIKIPTLSLVNCHGFYLEILELLTVALSKDVVELDIGDDDWRSGLSTGDGFSSVVDVSGNASSLLLVEK